MRTIVLGFLSTITSIFSFGQNQSADNAMVYDGSDFTEGQLNAIYEQTKSLPNNTQLSLAVIRNGASAFIGIERLNDRIILTQNHEDIYEIGSITKVFTSTLLADLVLKKALRLEDTITKSLPKGITIDAAISFKQLANHTSGLTRLPSNLDFTKVDLQDPYKSYDETKLLEYLNEYLSLENQPGAVYAYSNLGAGLLGYLVSTKQKKTFERALQDVIFSKYGMSSSTALKAKIKGKLVTGLGVSGEAVSSWDFNSLAGAGGIYSNIKDLTKFALAQFNLEDQVLALTRKETFTINSQMRIGLGWHLITTQSGSDLIWHNGGTGGYTASMALDVSKKNGVIVLSNVSALSPTNPKIDALCFSLLTSLKK